MCMYNTEGLVTGLVQNGTRVIHFWYYIPKRSGMRIILHLLTYCWKSQLSTHYPGINVGERVITNCAPLVVVAYLYPALVRTEYTSKTDISISARFGSIHWSCVIRPASRAFSSHNHNSVIHILNINDWSNILVYSFTKIAIKAYMFFCFFFVRFNTFWKLLVFICQVCHRSYYVHVHKHSSCFCFSSYFEGDYITLCTCTYVLSLK